jgi:hypothetical protein
MNYLSFILICLFNKCINASNCDMLLSTSDGTTINTSISNNFELWPKGEVFYSINLKDFNRNYKTSCFQNSFNNFNFLFVKAQQIKIIYEGMDTIERQTKNFDGTKCIQFLKWDKQTNFINIVNRQGCFSYVGKFVEKKSQLMSLNEKKCLTKKTVAHELMHALGFQHEQVR